MMQLEVMQTMVYNYVEDGMGLQKFQNATSGKMEHGSGGGSRGGGPRRGPPELGENPEKALENT